MAKKATKKTPKPVGHMKVIFPREFPSDSVMHWIGFLRGSETMSKGEMLQHSGIILGSAGVLLDGDPVLTGRTQAYGDPKAMTNDELADALEAAIAPRAESTKDAKAIPPWLIPFMPLILDAFRRYFGW